MYETESVLITANIKHNKMAAGDIATLSPQFY